MNDDLNFELNHQSSRVEKVKKLRIRKNRVTMLAIAILVLLLLGFSLYNIPRIERYIVVGTDKINDADILEASGIRKKEHIFKLDYDLIKLGIEKNPYLKVNSIKYSFPSDIEIDVYERKRDASIRHFSDDIIISRDGTVLEYGKAGSYIGVFRLLGLSMTGYSVGEKLGVSDDYQLMVTLKMLEALYSQDYWQDYRLLYVSNPVDVKLLSNNGITVRIGNIESLEEKLYRSSKYLRSTLRTNDGGVLDASTDSVAYRMSTAGSIEIPDELGEELEISLGDEDEIVDRQDISGISETETIIDQGIESDSGVTNDLPSIGQAETSNDGDLADDDSVQEETNPLEDLPEEGMEQDVGESSGDSGIEVLE